MSSSTMGSSQNKNYIKYKNRTSNCGKRAAVKFSESEKNSGRLYYHCELEVKQGGCHDWYWCNPINIPASLVEKATYEPNDNLNALVGRIDTMVQQMERKATMSNFITVTSFVFSGLALVMAMTALMKSKS